MDSCYWLGAPLFCGFSVEINETFTCYCGVLQNMAVTDLPRCACFFVWYSCVAVEVILFSFSDTPSDWHPLDREVLFFFTTLLNT